MKNEFELIGRITQKPNLIKTKIENLSFTLVNVAISKRIRQDNGEYKDYTDFIKVSYFRKIAEFIANYVNIGDLVLIKGHIKVRKDYDEQRRINIYTNELIGDNIKILVRNNKNKEVKEEIKEQPKESIKVSEMNFDDDDLLPF